MFTIEQIKSAQARVKSGADFPDYIKALRLLGVRSYETQLADGFNTYVGPNDISLKSESGLAPKIIADQCNKPQFQTDLKAHQQGKSDYPTFCNQCAGSGIAKWVVSLENMTCTYYDKKGNEILKEEIPG